MIPLSIEIHNFGAIPFANIDFSNIDTAVVVGKNGYGKSTAFVWAPLWILYGVTKNDCAVDDMVRRGTQEMSGTFKFEHNREVYQITRTRSTKGKGKSTLELQRLIGGRWESESGTTIRETEAKIRALLNLDAETFTASSMILQGKANEFTAKPAGQRKDVLKKVLGLDIYDTLLDKARAKEKAAIVSLEMLKSKITVLDEKLKDKPELEAEHVMVELEVEQVTADIKAKAAELKSFEETVRDLEAKSLKADELWEQIETLASEIASRQAERRQHQERLQKAQAVVSREAEILTNASEYERVKEQVTVLETKEPQLKEYGNEENRVRQEITRIEAALRRLEVQIRDTENTLAGREALEKAVVEYQTALTSLDAMEETAQKWNELNLDAIDYERKTADWDRHNEYTVSRLEEALSERRKQAALLDEVPCRDTEFSGKCPLISSALKAQKEIERLEGVIQVEKESKNPHTDQWQALIRERETLGYDATANRRLKNRAAELRPFSEQAAHLGAKAELLENLKQQRTQRQGELRSHQERLLSVKELARVLADELKPLADMRERLPILEKWAKTKEQLPAWQEIIKTATERIGILNTEIAAKEERGKSLNQERSNLLVLVADLDKMKLNVSNIQRFIDGLQLEQKELHVKAGGLKAQLDALASDEDKRALLAQKQGPAAKELTRWQALIKAFGRDGIPALIIENAVPELERIADAILGQMTNGKNSLRFETQRDAKSRSGQIETLDIIVGDWTGEGPYETFSGGEQLRIDFAIRFALAELLANRAGSKVEWLTIDEGLGSQDAEHRTLVLEAIKSVADRFKKTIVITHIEEAQAMFEERIYFEPKDDGVEILVA